jgi:hypothetical protein
MQMLVCLRKNFLKGWSHLRHSRKEHLFNSKAHSNQVRVFMRNLLLKTDLKLQLTKLCRRFRAWMVSDASKILKKKRMSTGLIFILLALQVSPKSSLYNHTTRRRQQRSQKRYRKNIISSLLSKRSVRKVQISGEVWVLRSSSILSTLKSHGPRLSLSELNSILKE